MAGRLVEPGGEPDRVGQLDAREHHAKVLVADASADPLPRQREAEQSVGRAVRGLRREPEQRAGDDPGRLHPPRMLRAVADDLATRLLESSELHGDFVLSSGKRSSVYFDKFRFLTDPRLLRELASAVAGILPPTVTLLAAP